MPRIALMSGSARAASIHLALLRAAETLLADRGAEVDWLDLGAADLPIYHGDVDATDGPPAAAAELTGRLAAADGLLIASPEYNGGPSGLLKNGIDWMTRVDKAAFQGRPIGLLAASPGGKGARHGLGQLEAILRWMLCDVHDAHFSVPTINDHLADGDLTGPMLDELAAWLDGYLAAVGDGSGQSPATP